VRLGDLGGSWGERQEALESSWFMETGLPLPDISVVPSPTADPELLQVRVSGRPGLPLRALGPDELLVQADVDRVREEGIGARAEIDPLSGRGGACVSIAARERLEAARLPFLDSETQIMQVIAQELRRNRRRLLTIEDLEYQLSTLNVMFPAVVSAALMTFPLGTLARTARLLVAEDVPVNDLRTLLNRLLESEYEARIDPNDQSTNGSSPVASGAEAHADFVRAGLHDLFAYRHGQDGQCSVIRIAPALERRLGESPGLPEPEADGVLDELRSIVAAVVDEVRPPVVLTTRAARRPVRSILEPEVPGVSVLSHDELPLRLRRVTLHTIGSA
jgi:type III secretory pathway component EscV